MHPTTRPFLTVGPDDRAAFLALAARRLAPGQAVVRAIDTYRSSGAVTLQAPLDPKAEIVAREPPRLQPGGITEIVTYLLVRDTTVRQTTVRDGDVERDDDVVLRPLALSGRVIERSSRPSGLTRER